MVGRGGHCQQRGAVAAVERNAPVRIEMGKDREGGRGRRMVKASKEVKSMPVINTRLHIMYKLSRYGATTVFHFSATRQGRSLREKRLGG
jgi:hypothetical protein